MAEEKKDEGREAVQLALFVLGSLAFLIALWYFTGGPSRADLRGIFLTPPPPLNSGDAYGRQPETPTNQN